MAPSFDNLLIISRGMFPLLIVTYLHDLVKKKKKAFPTKTKEKKIDESAITLIDVLYSLFFASISRGCLAFNKKKFISATFLPEWPTVH